MAPSSSLVVRELLTSFKSPLDRQREQEASAERKQGKIKVQLKLSISRLRMVQQKDTAIAKQQRRAMAQLLEVCCSWVCCLNRG